jgi:hypothetical protein
MSELAKKLAGSAGAGAVAGGLLASWWYSHLGGGKACNALSIVDRINRFNGIHCSASNFAPKFALVGAVVAGLIAAVLD